MNLVRYTARDHDRFAAAKGFFLAGLVGVAILAVSNWIEPFRIGHSPAADRRAVIANTLRVDAGERAIGSGFIVKRHNSGGSRLFVWTNAHVAEGHDHLKLRQFFHADGRKLGEQSFDGLVLECDQEKDVALIWLLAPSEMFSGLEFDDRPLEIGSPVYHVGNFRGMFDRSYAEGVVSQLGVTVACWDNLDQTTALIVPGSSGGSLIDARNGRVAGIVCAWGLIPGIGLFIPVREIEAWAAPKSLRWAVRGHVCPEDVTLSVAAKAVALQLIAEKQKQTIHIIELFRNPQPDYDSDH